MKMMKVMGENLMNFHQGKDRKLKGGQKGLQNHQQKQQNDYL